MVKLKINKESGIEDTQTIIQDISELHKQFVGPIDRLRSLSKPSPQSSFTRVPQSSQSLHEFITQNNFNNIEINPDRPLESRAHCFYRMLGLPVVAPDGSFYSSGFEPNSTTTLDKREKVNKALLADQNLQTIMLLRERDVQTRRSTFVRQNIDSTAYALALRYTRSFSEYIDKNLGPLKADKQTYTIPDRIFETDRVGSKANFNSASHILRPFIVNPLIADTVMPANNLVCVPFLASKEDTKIDLNVSLLRPGIEFILRMRLQENSSNIDFLNEVKRIISQQGSESDSETAQDVRNTISVITGESDLATLQNSPAFDSIVGNISSVQFSTINILIKTIKLVLEKLDYSIREFDALKNSLNFEPIPTVEGPEYGGNIRTSGGTGLSEYEQKIGLLRIMDLNAQQQQKVVSDRLGGGSELFATSVVSVTQKDYSSEIAGLTKERDDLASQAIEHMSNIEKIVGEVSGLGLIDVLCIYTALWAIDLDVLLGLIDDEAFERLYSNNPELRTTEVNERHDGFVFGGIEVLTKFESKLFNILNFADKIFDQLRSSPQENNSGDI